MREHFKNRLRNFRKDRLQYGSCAIIFILLICHIWQFFDSNFMTEPLIRIIFCSVYIPFVFIFGRNIAFWIFLIFAYVLTLQISFENYSPFIIITLFCLIKMQSWELSKNLKLLIPVLSVYVFCVLIVCQLHKKDSSHLVIHFINCFIIFFVSWYFIKIRHKTSKNLVLDEDQKAILKELSEGKLQKEISLFSKNTITKKINDAIIENHLMTKEQLLLRFISEYVEIY